MNDTENFKVTTKQARAFLADYLGTDSVETQLIGEGAWSRCFAFHRNGEDLVIRFGNYAQDFQQDKLAYSYNSPNLPIPKVLEIGEAFGGYYAVSTRIYGVPLESLNANEWRATVPAVVAALEAMRLVELPPKSGIGGWGGEGQAPYTAWSEHLLAVADDGPLRRTYGWTEKLATFPQGPDTFKWGFELLKGMASHAVPRCLVHCDLINRNVLVEKGKLSGVFDWGCALYGDHLYDLAWFEFWAPWYPKLDTTYLRSALERHWTEVGYAPENKDSRLLACYLHIGLDHLAYNAYFENWSDLAETVKRMKTLVAVTDI